MVQWEGGWAPNPGYGPGMCIINSILFRRQRSIKPEIIRKVKLNVYEPSFSSRVANCKSTKATKYLVIFNNYVKRFKLQVCKNNNY